MKKNILESAYPYLNAYVVLKEIGNCGYPSGYAAILNALARQVADILAEPLKRK